MAAPPPNGGGTSTPNTRPACASPDAASTGRPNRETRREATRSSSRVPAVLMRAPCQSCCALRNAHHGERQGCGGNPSLALKPANGLVCSCRPA
eukprot:scaffold1618_cov397-Prasinococcus_capsulatus_cf.AAC.4